MAEPGWVEQVGGVKQSHIYFLSVYAKQKSNCGIILTSHDVIISK